MENNQAIGYKLNHLIFTGVSIILTKSKAIVL